MRPWLDPDLLPSNDFPGFAAEVDWTRRTLARDGSLPAWTPDRYGGTTRFMSNAKEIATYPLAASFGAVQGTKLMFVLARIVAAFGLYLVCVSQFGSPAAGLLAGYAYGFGPPANLQSTLGGHLDLAISSALLPFIVLAAAALFRAGRWRDALALGSLTALEFLVHSYLQAMIVPPIVLLLAALRPWRGGRDGEGGGGDAGPRARRRLVLTAGAAAVFLALGASQAAWLAADLPNHALHSPEAVEHGVRTYVEHSPFMFVNRSDWLGSWLRDHAPPGLLLSGSDPGFNQRRYLGVVPLLACLLGWFLVRTDRSRRRWYQTFLLLFTLQYWLAVGPHTLAWQLARSFRLPIAVDVPLRVALTAGALACLAWAAHGLRRRRTDPDAVPAARVELALGLGLAQIVVAHSAFDALRAVLPVMRGMRSPGHFFDLAHLALYAMFGVVVAAGLGRLAARSRLVAGAAVAASLVLDFAPTAAEFARREDFDTLRAVRSAVHSLPGEDGTLRIASLPSLAPPRSSLVTATAAAGSAWGWLHWQAGRHWETYLGSATAGLSPEPRDAAARDAARRIGDALMTTGRLTYFLEEFGGMPRPVLAPPWRRISENRQFALWGVPSALPMGTVFSSFVLLVGAPDWEHPPVIADCLERGVLTVVGGARLADADERLLAAAAAVRYVGGDALRDAPSRALAARHAERLIDVGDPAARQRWAQFLARHPSAAVSAAAYARPAPDRMRFDVGGGSAPAMLFVSEAYHPWWRAHVDGAPAQVLRAQLAFMAVAVPAGGRRVELVLSRPPLVAAADGVALLSWLLLLGGGAVAAAVSAWRRVRRLRAAPRSDASQARVRNA